MANVCATVASRVQVAQKNPAPGTATEGGTVLMDSVCATPDSQVQTALKGPVPTTATTVGGV